MQIRLSGSLQNVIKRLPWCGNMGIDTRNISVSDMLEKNILRISGFKYYVNFNIMLIYVNLCKLNGFVDF